MTSLFRTGPLVALLAVAGCFGSGDRPQYIPPQPPGPAEVDLTQTFQRIDGFGASSAWTGGNITDAMADLFFTADTGIGLSLLRVQIKPTGNTLELATAQKAVARGAKVWASPWSPPGEWKDNGTATNGGQLLDEHRQDWANRLAAFATSMAAQGIPLVALSAQNEPNFVTNKWETCHYEPAPLVTFIRDFLGPALAASGQAVPVMAPETQGWDGFKRYADALMADTVATGMIGPVATHNYGGAIAFDYEPTKAAGKVLWETEVSDDMGNNNMVLDTTIESGVRVAKMIHDNMVKGGVSAFHYWWLMPGSGGGNGALSANGALLPRAWAMGNWSRFVRPGFVRIAVTPQPQDYVNVSAFKDPAGTRVVVVAVNTLSNERSQDFTIAGGTVGQLVPWTTADGKNLVAQSPVGVVDGAFTYKLPGKSVTSFVGDVTP
ncbi:MAG TPA: glycoside hydrolase family 30 beta sandwich domain-containing protein [Polyangia bacterium]|jgi:glucuronoarabinoxylan endo-1,4-beta-xylanase|nr:glycoside hydrolase family 30 beta sandwich domain-containing protein [Polyangia bacterium]